MSDKENLQSLSEAISELGRIAHESLQEHELQNLCDRIDEQMAKIKPHCEEAHFLDYAIKTAIFHNSKSRNKEIKPRQS